MLDLVIDLETNRFIPRESQKSYFRRGVEEATKFLPNGSNLRFDLVGNGLALAETSKNSVQQIGNSKLTNGRKSRGKKQSGKRNVVDLRTLLIQCAQSVAADDRRSANDLLKQIRQHASPFENGNQRLAHCFVDGLEARLAGTGSKFYMALLMKKMTVVDILKAACPFKKISNFFQTRQS
ncbi:hypothetical protein GIB67_016346 [Kingdonia uniflora]|uniref:Uncharacterized protein n=1 Tax=Kingdonia uniflora TaxID=39325 RepID=A0A7J7M9T9_9MAGN|nr:hypothetical protein GIB67_016346 [Kingdonia uniflora]